MSVVNAGIDPAPWAVVLTGLAGGPEFAPLIANRTTGHALVFRGAIGVGSRLTIAPSAADPTALHADLDGHDVTDRLDSYLDLVPGPDGPGTRGAADPVPTLALGSNELWFLPLAHYDTPGLGRFLFALADDALPRGALRRHLVRPLPVRPATRDERVDRVGGTRAGELRDPPPRPAAAYATRRHRGRCGSPRAAGAGSRRRRRPPRRCRYRHGRHHESPRRTPARARRGSRPSSPAPTTRPARPVRIASPRPAACST